MEDLLETFEKSGLGWWLLGTMALLAFGLTYMVFKMAQVFYLALRNGPPAGT